MTYFIITWLISALIASAWGWESAECGSVTLRGVLAGMAASLTWPVVVIAWVGGKLSNAMRTRV